MPIFSFCLSEESRRHIRTTRLLTFSADRDNQPSKLIARMKRSFPVIQLRFCFNPYLHETSLIILLEWSLCPNYDLSILPHFSQDRDKKKNLAFSFIRNCLSADISADSVSHDWPPNMGFPFLRIDRLSFRQPSITAQFVIFGLANGAAFFLCGRPTYFNLLCMRMHLGSTFYLK